MKYLLDSDICIFLLKNKYSIVQKIESIGIENWTDPLHNNFL